MHRRTLKALALTTTLAVTLSLAACGGDDDAGSGTDVTAAKGPITIWYSNNEQEVAWGKAMVESWNAAHADQLIEGQEIPAGKSSEEVIGAAITAGTAPCLVFNTAPSAVGQFQRQGGLVEPGELPRRRQLHRRTLRPGGRPVQGTRRRLLPAALEVEPGDDLLQQGPVHEGRSGPGESRAVDLRGVPGRRPQDQVIQGGPVRDLPGADQPVLPDPVRLHAALRGADQGPDDRGGRKATFADPAGIDVATFWKTLYDEGLAGKEVYQGDSFVDKKAAMSVVGPWAISVYDKVKWGVSPRADQGWNTAAETYTFSDAKNVGLYSACKNQGTAWEVLKFATSVEQDGLLLEKTGQMPLRKDLQTAYPDYFTKNKDYQVRRSGRADDRGAARPAHRGDVADPARRVHQDRDQRRR